MHDHDVGQLEVRTEEFRTALRRLFDDDWEELIRIWRRPGWTTPAEFLFATSILESLQLQAEALGNLKKGLTEASREVSVGKSSS